MKRMVAIWIALLLLLQTVLVASAAQTQTGSISITMTYRGKVVSGGSVTLYYVAALDDSGKLAYNSAFRDCTISLEHLDAEEAAMDFAEFIRAKKIEGATKKVSLKGTVTFPDLPLGLYCVIQNEAASGYYPAAPFLITVPIRGENGWNYHVDASPKMELTKEPSSTEPTEPTQPTQPTEPTRPTTPNIPQTGQLNWPIPIMVIGGIVLFAFGWALCFVMKNKKNEE